MEKNKLEQALIYLKERYGIEVNPSEIDKINIKND